MNPETRLRLRITGIGILVATALSIWIFGWRGVPASGTTPAPSASAASSVAPVAPRR